MNIKAECTWGQSAADVTVDIENGNSSPGELCVAVAAPGKEYTFCPEDGWLSLTSGQARKLAAELLVAAARADELEACYEAAMREAAEAADPISG